MSFVNPLGLLGLIGVPIIIIIYILRNKFNEQTVTSTYIWELSERFFKRRNPLSAIAGIISLILQLLLVVTISLAIAKPRFIVPDSAGEYCFVIDSSASMGMGGIQGTRFDRAKAEIGKVIDEASLGSTFTLAYASDETTVVYERLTDKVLAREMLDSLECASSTGSFPDAVAVAQSYFNDNPSFLVYLFTDKSVGEHNNVEIVNVSLQNEQNYAISNVASTHMGSELSVSADVISYASDARLEVLLYVDGSNNYRDKQTVEVKAGEPLAVSLSYRTDSYESYRVVITNADALPSDNEFVGYNHKYEDSYNILIVSDTPFFLQAALDVLTDAKVDTVSTKDYTGADEYGLCIFHSYTPEVLPDTAVWLINSNRNVDDSGFGARGVIELDNPIEIVKSDSTASTAQKLLSGVEGRDIAIGEYVKYSGMYTKFTTLFSCDSNPVIFAGVNGLGNREVVIGFDLHKADIALSTDFVVLLGNLLNYACPNVVERAYYSAGEDAEINITSRTKNVKAVSPSGEELYIDTSLDTATFKLNEVGTYTVNLTYAGEEKTYKIYSGIPTDESNPTESEDSFSLMGEQQFERTDGEFDPIVIIFILLALIFTADWMVYCYEKYQLR
ncbi:MAG: VWA domain-containing protein [Clostridia bacterium]|nr:VWA domain-containing protein [Clostridia bacterium]